MRATHLQGIAMAERFRLTLAQLNPTVGAIDHNARMVRDAWRAARDAGAQMIAFPEMFLTGYQTQDLVMHPAFLSDVEDRLAGLASECADGPAIGLGAPLRRNGRLYNAWHVMQGGAVVARIAKHHLPNESVFDECRLFTSGDIAGPYRIGPLRIGTPICEDAWFPDVAEAQQESGAQILLVPNGSPYSRGRLDARMMHMVARVVETGLPLVYLNMAGGQDDQVFDGASFVLNPGGRLAVQLAPFDETLVHVDFEETPEGWRALPGDLANQPDAWEQDYHAMVTGLRDYVRKSGFESVLLGLSGGVDSALVAAIATDALGAGRVHCILLPSRFTAQGSVTDAQTIAAALGCRLDTLPIDGPHTAMEAALAPLMAGTAQDATEENLQSRIRGTLLMALSNKFGGLLLTTGNKSELAVGYATIYGDMNGGYNPIKDLYKTRVFETCRWRNANHRAWMAGPAGAVIPERVIDKPPSAELRDNQRDDDSLPPYDVLDAILEGLVDRQVTISHLVGAGHDRDTVLRVQGLLYAAEWKRFQSAPGVRLSRRAFGTDRRYPMVNRWRDRG